MGTVATCIGFSLAGTTFMYIVYRTTVMYMFIVLDTTEPSQRKSAFSGTMAR